MNSIQYEELCRFYLADKLKVNVSEVRSVRLPNPSRPGLPQYKHQIDLYWEISNELVLYLNIANAKWRGTQKVEQGEILLLQQVKQDLDAHKAMMITNTGFTSGAEAVAQDKGIALHIVTPNFEYNKLNPSNRQIILNQIQEFSSRETKPIYNYEIQYRAFDLVSEQTPPSSSKLPSYQNKMVSGKGVQKRIITPQYTKNIGISRNGSIQREVRKGSGSSNTSGPTQRGGNPYKGGNRSK